MTKVNRQMPKCVGLLTSHMSRITTLRLPVQLVFPDSRTSGPLSSVGMPAKLVFT